MKTSQKTLIQNLSYAFISQGMTLLLSLLITLIIPRVFEVEDFDFWQLFMFFLGYGGALHLGLNDGIYLRFGGKKYDELDHDLLGAQLRISVLKQALIGFVIILISSIFIPDGRRMFVIIMAVCYSIVANVSMFLGFIFQATNHIKVFAKSNFIYTTLSIVLILVLLWHEMSSLVLLISLHIFSRIVALSYLVVKGKEIIFTKPVERLRALKEIRFNIKIGFSLMMALTMGTFILGVGRVIIDTRWGIEVFGQVSFSLLIAKLFLVFISQISFVMFPVLRRAKSDKQRQFYLNARYLLGLVLPLILLAYIPLELFIRSWIPTYEGSLKFMIFLLPMCVFEGKTKMLSATYFKIRREEKVLLKINIICVALCSVLSLISLYIFNSVDVVVVCMAISMIIRNILSELYLSKQFDISVHKNIVLELSLVVVFVILHWLLPAAVATIGFLLLYVVYMWITRYIKIGEVLV